METRQLHKDITCHVRVHCDFRFDDPQTGECDMCSARHAVHCIAIDNPLYHADKGVSMCTRFNTFPPMQGTQQGATKECTMCHKQFNPASNRQRVCAACGKIAAKRAARDRQKRARQNVTL